MLSSKSKATQENIFFQLLSETCVKYNITLYASHVPREHNIAADHLSKHRVDKFKQIFPNTFDNPKKIKKLLFLGPLRNVDVREEKGRIYHNIEYPSESSTCDQGSSLTVKYDLGILPANSLEMEDNTNSHENSHDSSTDLSEERDVAVSSTEQPPPSHITSNLSQNMNYATNHNLPMSNTELLKPFSRHKQHSLAGGLEKECVKQKDGVEFDMTNHSKDKPENSDHSGKS